MYVEAVALFLFTSLLFYTLFGGADFGAGILELFVGRHRAEEQKAIFAKAMGPVWEANHIWLVLAVVILFNGFPAAYREISILLHLPLLLMLVGITLRGCAFTFRHYDAVRDRSQRYYEWLFVAGSLVTPFSFGLIVGGATGSGIRDPDIRKDFFVRFVSPWLDVYPVALGLFFVGLFAAIAASYLVGETADPDLRGRFVGRARAAWLVTVGLGGLVFVTSGGDFAGRFFSERVPLLCLAAGTGALAALLVRQSSPSQVFPRFLVGIVVTAILAGWAAVEYPVIVSYAHGGGITLHEAAAPEATLRYLLYALAGGMALLFPALFYLLRVFKTSPEPRPGVSSPSTPNRG